MKILCAFVLVAALVAGCGHSAEIPAPPAAGEARIIKAWSAVTNDAAVKAVFRSGEATPPVRWLASGAVEMPVDFSGRKPPARANWDLRLNCDLRAMPGIQFDFFCEDLAQFSGFSCYFRSGDGWYHGHFSPEENGVWQHVEVSKALCNSEGKPAGWGNISSVRISGWRIGDGVASCAIANVAAIGGTPDVAVVYADSLAAKGGAEAKGYMQFAGTVSSTLRALGADPVIVADTDVDADMLRRMSAVVLPYNPQMPAKALEHVRAYVAGGGRILACYSQPREIYELLGVKMRGMERSGANGRAALAGFLRTGNGLAGQPAFAPQASWISALLTPAEGTEVMAEWADGQQQSLGIPAIVRSRTGIYMGHVWLGGVDGAPAELMRAIAGELAPALGAKMSAHADAQRRRAEENRAWLAGRSSKAGEHRAFWCHSAYGLGGDRDWDASVKFLKDNGFNVLIPNLCWGGVAFYPSLTLPVSPDVATRGDAFAQCRAACTKYGVKMHVWKVCWNMGSYTSKAFEEEMKNAGRTQVDAKGKPYSRWLCPSHPLNQQLEIDAMLELAKKGPDGIHFDYIRYPGGDCCFCAGCRARFEAMLGHAVTNWPGVVHGGEATLRKEWRTFRTDNITKVVRTVAERVRREAPGVQISAALFRNPVSDVETVAQDWSRWCREGWLDFACHMDYVESAAMFRSQVKSQMAAAGKTRLYPGIGLSCWLNDGQDGVRLAKQIEVARELGLGGFTVFNFDRRAERVLPLLRMGITRED